MPNTIKDFISEEFGCQPIIINSALVSAQERKRYYWTNIPGIQQPVDKEIYFKDILEYKNNNIYNKLIPVQYDRKNGIGKELTKSITLCASDWRGLNRNQKQNAVLNLEDMGIRRLTPLECERLQTVPEGYTEGVSNTQKYKMLGNGWTIDIIAHILSYIK